MVVQRCNNDKDGIYRLNVTSLSARKKYTWFLNCNLKTQSLWTPSDALGRPTI